MHLLEHLNAHFPGLRLDPPLYYGWPIALRFELNTKRTNPPDFQAVTARAITIYESAFATKNVAYIISVSRHFVGAGHQRPFGYQPIEDNRLFPFARRHRFGISRPSGIAKLRHNRQEIEDWGASSTRIEWTEISPRQINYHTIFDKIAHEDFPGGAGFNGDVYLYNQTRNLILHMYDDRGLDLIATTRAVLQPIHDQHKAWLISDDDRTADFRKHRLQAVDFST